MILKLISIIVLVLFLVLNIIRKNHFDNFTDYEPKNYIFKNQYLIVHENENENKNVINDIYKMNFDNLNFYIGSDLEFYNNQKGKNKIFIIGLVIDPLNYKRTIEEIGNNLITSTNIDNLFNKVQNLSGRFIIYFNLNGNKIIFNDCCALKRIFYLKNKVVFSSSEKIILNFFNLKKNIPKDKKDYINSTRYRNSEFKWYDNSGFNENIKLVLPNTYYNIENKNIKRIPFFFPNIKDYNQICQRISDIIGNSIKCLIFRNYKLIQPITAGSDSRVLLSCVKQNLKNINFYIFNNNKLKNSANVDAIVAKKISDKFNLNFKDIKIKNDKLSDKFKILYSQNHVIPRILPKTKNIEYHFNNNLGKININGNCAEVLKEYFNNSDLIKSFEIFRLKIRQKNNINYIQKSIKKYFEENVNFCIKNNIDICNLYYWELQQGLWGSLYPYEQDIAINEFSPFNNRSLLLLGLSTERKNRTSKSGYKLFQDIISKNFPELMFIKFNPKINEII